MINTNYEIQQEPSVGEALKDFEKSAITLLSSILSGNFKSKKTNEATVKKEADLLRKYAATIRTFDPGFATDLISTADRHEWPLAK